MEPNETVYFANPGPDGKFNPDYYFHWADYNNEPINEWDKVASTLLSIPMAHQLIGFYTVADDSDGVLKVMRSYQYFAASAISDKVSKTKWEAVNQLGGYVWHTTGSGETMTSFKSAQLIASSKDADKVIFLMDRIELGTQSLKEYRGFADENESVQATENTGVLITKLKSTDPADTLIVTSIQKMSNIKDEAGGLKASDIEYINGKRIVFIVDEAHRMLKWKFGWGVQRNVDVIDKLFNASRVNVFLIDEDQVVTTSDDLSIKQIKEYAEKYGSKVIEDNRMILSSQFRCVGGEQYIAFVNHFLGYTNDYVSLKGMKYKVGIMDSMKDMMKKWNELWDSNHQMRLIAGYTHEWVSQNDPEKYDFEYEDGTNLRWNIKKADRAAILDDSQKENVFCIHTIQGLEVEYAGVIIGKDLTYNKERGQIEFHKEMNAHSDFASGIRNANDSLAEKLIRNTYKVLLTRGVKGTFIYAEDDNLREYLKQLVKN